ncbi:MAG: Urocanate hydratase, partial [uncultured Microvirga sp.]
GAGADRLPGAAGADLLGGAGAKAPAGDGVQR